MCVFMYSLDGINAMWGNNTITKSHKLKKKNNPVPGM